MNNTNPKISVVIPAYNEEEYITYCLQSIKRQNFKDFELIVVDNNSTDKTAEIARHFGARVVKEKIQGITPAREKGFKEAKAEIIARTDADSQVPGDWLERIYNIFQNNHDVVAISGGHKSINCGKYIDILLDFWVNYIVFYISKLLMGHYQFTGPNYAVRKSIWEKTEIHSDDQLVHEDMDLSCHMAMFGKIAYHPEIKTVFSARRYKKRLFYTIIEYTIR